MKSPVRENFAAAVDAETRALGRDGIAALVGAARLLPRQLGRVRHGQLVDASAYLRLAAVLGLDPGTGQRLAYPQSAPVCRATVLWWMLGAALTITRIGEGWTIRRAASACKVSIATLSRLERGGPVSIDTMLSICAWIGRHPYDFTGTEVQLRTVPPAAVPRQRRVSRATCGETKGSVGA